MMTSVIAVDLDDTLLRSDKTVSERTFRALDAWQERGSQIVVATGRPRRSMERIPERLQVYPWICYNGAMIYENGEIVYSTMIPTADARHIVRAIQEAAPDCRVGVEIEDNLFVNQQVDWPWVHHVEDLLTVLTRPAAKILLSLKAYQDLSPVVRELPASAKALVSDKYNLVQIMPVHASKAEALAVLMERWGRSLEEVVAFGDDTNDVEMIAESGIGVAMGNAVPEVKAVADRITGTNDEDGVAQMLEELLVEV
jgi:hypothetical protein